MIETRALKSALSQGVVAVIGDVVLDAYVSGEVGRISPEAPVPVLHVREERAVLGAAANVAANVAALGGSVRLVGAVGDDADGARIDALLGAWGTVNADLVRVTDRATTVKTRVVAHQQQIVRIDRERVDPYDAATEEALIAAAVRAVAGAGCVVLSDYGKGVWTDAALTAVLAAAEAAGALTIVDPKRRQFHAYRGAAFVSPNRKELTDATGLPCGDDAEAQAAARAAHEQCGAAILLTRSERGMSLFRDGAAPIHLAAEAREVFDVSGAGDTVVATFALGLSAGLPVEEAMQAANAAAGVVVARRGTAVCAADELVEALARAARRRDAHDPQDAGPQGSAVLPLAAAEDLCARWRRAGLTVGFANGCFDLLHPGHVSLLRQAAAACDRLVVALNSDASVARLKGPTRPIQPQEARAAVIAGVKGVDAVILFEEDTPLQAIQALKPDVLIKGADYAEADVVGADFVKARGGRVVLAALTPEQSTTRLAARVAAAGAPDEPTKA